MADPDPRASRIPIPGRADLTTEIWMGGAYATIGERVTVGDLSDAWLLDMAGLMPDSHRAACGHLLDHVFNDYEETPADYERLAALARSIGACLDGREGLPDWEHPQARPPRLYVMCSQGLNRSGLLVGLILRALGVSGNDALAAIGTRPGSLTNQTFVRLVLEFSP
jgi:hypothetical protein